MIAVVLSVLIHGSIGYAMLPALRDANSEALDMGKGTDIVLVEQGIAEEGISKLGDAMETIETAEIKPVQAAPPPPPEQVKPDELRDVIASEESTVEQEVVKTDDPPPIKEPPPPEAVQAQSQPEQIAVVTQQSSGEEKSGGNAKMLGLYLGQVNDHVQRAKVNPRSAIAGTVIVRFTIDVDGKLLSKEVAKSSGSKVLDDAATAALDRAAPFPPIPPEVSIKPLAFTQPFKFVMR
ncbi:TonB family protein [Hyphomicrobium denitrificans 1NES1]|uniref:TonB family protein n=2 Tax=Hyphomicrobium denitrificans TaxID=53399 RepID=N0B8V3_9HYPH|nr:TonB family protein [Hyphomicrobium denitrificans 1NES1]